MVPLNVAGRRTNRAPSRTGDAGAQAAVKALTADGLFPGQTPAFFNAMKKLAAAADAANRH